ncbi:MAG: preprotein translocase subunit SecA [Parcubacteria group bacterium]|nr:preprotein translocase subunit SecA [Parcubacteria group bacterium]
MPSLRSFSETLHKTDGALCAETARFHEQLARGISVKELLPRAFAVVREAAKRTLGQRHYDVQILGGAVLHEGKIAEMKTGEGKTLVATLAAYVNALSGKGVHIVTVNDYLSRRDAVWMGQIYHFLGLSVGCINHDSSFMYDPYHAQIQNSKIKYQNDNEKLKIENEKLDEERDVLGGFKVVHEYLRPCSRREAYRADITYGTNNEFGFDYLRDNMAYAIEQRVQRTEEEGGLHYAIIDEVDSILIDEARTPLIISAPDTTAGELYQTFSQIAPRLEKEKDYSVDEKLRAVSITEEGIEKVEHILGVGDIYTEGGIKYVHHLEQALRAEVIFQRDRDYVVKSGEVIIVDEFTGRLMPGRRWSDGLHQAIEAKEGVVIQQESRTMATITFQNLFRMYENIAGMTGTAHTSQEEFHKVYNLDVVSIPTNKPNVRKDMSDRVYQTERGKFMAVVREIKERANRGQPVLVGTVSIEKNELLSALLQKEGIKHELLNAKNHEREAEIIAQAGRKGAVTVATNMAGRGVDIVLGGNPSDSEAAKDVCRTGGLFILGTERHEARRIDDQLRGRSGRQGDPGATQFFVSFEDELFRVFGPDRVKRMMGSFGIPEDQPIEHRLVSRAIESAQKKIEGMHFDTRKHLLDYDDVMNRQRVTVYNRRRAVLFAETAEMLKKTDTLLRDELEALVTAHTQEPAGEWEVKTIADMLQAQFPSGENILARIETARKEGGDEEICRMRVNDIAFSLWEQLFAKRKEEVGADALARTLKMVLLQTMDMVWVDHLEAMEHMRSSVRLRAYGQHDPLVEYKNEGLRLFRELEARVRAHFAQIVLRFPAEKSAGQRVAISAKIGRNDPCPCGAKRPDGTPVKYKRCHGR